MNYSLKRSSKVYIVKNGVGYPISTLSNFTLSQTISEKTVNRRNLFNRTAPKDIINRSSNAGTGSLEFYFNRNCVALRHIFESFDFISDFNTKFTFNNSFSAVPMKLGLTVYDTLSDKYINIDSIYFTNIDIQCSPSNMNKITVGFVYAKMDENEAQAYLASSLPVQFAPIEYIDFRLLNSQIHSVTSAAYTITRSIKWTDSGANQFNLGSVASVSSPIVTEFDISANVMANDNLDRFKFKHLGVYNTDVILGNNSLYISIPGALVTTRKEPSEVFTISFDIKHKSLSPVHIGGTYNGNIN